jgi:hypothetical protein
MKTSGNSWEMWIGTMAAAAILGIFSAISFAQTANQPIEDGIVQKFNDVEELMDKVKQYDGRKIQVSGEIDKIIDQHSFILESGGFFNDEITVLMPGSSIAVKEDSNVTVTGVIRTADLDEIEREYGWNTNPQDKAKLRKVKAFLISYNITPNKDKDGDKNG